MRSKGLWLGVGLVLMSGTAFGQKYKASDILAGFKPTFAGVDYDTPTDAAELAACRLEDLKNGAGWEVKDGQGKLLRRFADTNGKVTKRDRDPKATTHIDQWSYFRDGFEVYREVDLDEDGGLDEVRWLNQGGIRIGTVRGNKLVAWKRLSPEEATKVYVTALVARDAAMLETVIATPEELKSLGMPDAAVQEAGTAATARAKSPAEAFRLPKGWDEKTTWSRFDGWMPHSIPTDAAPGLSQEVLLYENGVIFAASADTQGQQPALGYLHVPELVRVGDAWKFFRAPRAVDPQDPVVANLEQGSLRSLLFGPATANVASNPDEKPLLELAKLLAEYDTRMPSSEAARDLAQWHVERMRLIDKEGIKKVTSEENRTSLYKQVTHDLAEAYRSGYFPAGANIFKNLVAMGGEVGSFADYRLILAEFDLAASEPNAKLETLHEETLKKLEGWLVKYQSADEVPEVLLQLATAYDLENDEEKARKFYGQLATQFPETESGKKAAGAIRRLDATGKPFSLTGPTLAGKPIRSTDFAGKSLVVVFWMSIAEPDRRELSDLAELASKFKEKNVEVVTVNLDLDKAAAEQYVKTNNLAWPVIHEPGGLESRLGTEYGIVATPTIILVDPQGKVVSARIRKASEIQRFLDKPLAAGNSDLEISR